MVCQMAGSKYLSQNRYLKLSCICGWQVGLVVTRVGRRRGSCPRSPNITLNGLAVSFVLIILCIFNQRKILTYPRGGNYMH